MSGARARAWRTGVGAAWVVVLAFLAGCAAPSRPARPTVSPSAWEREVERWIGTPYRWGGNDRHGIDCSGFVQQVQSRVAGVRLPRTTREQFRVGLAVGRRELRPGDLVFFRTTGSGVSHVGLVVDGERFAHASESRGVRYSQLGESYWARNYLGARRVTKAPEPARGRR